MENVNGSHGRYVTVGKFVELYPVGRTYTYRLIREKKIRAKKLFGKNIIDTVSADEFFESLPDFGEAA